MTTDHVLFSTETAELEQWMAHCHIAEHTESGMMFSFHVARRPEPVR